MKITWLGHASFLIQSEETCLITDPFAARVGYPIYAGKTDIATVSHDHYDHNAVELLQGEPQIINQAGEFVIDALQITGLATWHDKLQGKERGNNIAFKIVTEGIAILHLGDLGHGLTPELIARLGAIDILMVPVGGRYTVNADEAFTIVDLLKPRIIMPMHYKTPLCTINLSPVEAFTMKFDRVVKLPYLWLERSDLDRRSGVILLDYPN